MLTKMLRYRVHKRRNSCLRGFFAQIKENFPSNTFFSFVAKALAPFKGEIQKKIQSSDAVASRLQISDLYKFDLQVASQFANWSKRASEHVD